jgi:hypothetical protein
MIAAKLDFLGSLQFLVNESFEFYNPTPEKLFIACCRNSRSEKVRRISSVLNRRTKGEQRAHSLSTCGRGKGMIQAKSYFHFNNRVTLCNQEDGVFSAYFGVRGYIVFYEPNLDCRLWLC